MDLKFRNNIHQKNVVVDHQLAKETGQIPKKNGCLPQKNPTPPKLNITPLKKKCLEN